MGIKKLTSITWATQVWTTVDELIPFVDETLTREFERIESESKTGSGARDPSDQGREVVKGTTKHQLDYNNFDSLMEGIYGSVSSRQFDISDDHLDVYFCVEIEKQVSRWRFWPGKITKATITGEKNGIIMLELEWIFREGTRSATAFPSISPLAQNHVLFQSLTHRIADQADAIAAGDVLGIDSFSIEHDNVLIQDDQDSESDQQIIEPIPGGKRNITYGIKKPRYTADTLPDWKDANTALQADLVFSAGGETFTVWLPELRITEGFNAETPGSGAYIQEGKFEVRKSSNAFMFTGTEIRATFT